MLSTQNVGLEGAPCGTPPERLGALSTSPMPYAVLATRACPPTCASMTATTSSGTPIVPVRRYAPPV
eukprot:5709055-Prymnesium_polylepis.1